MNQNEHTGEYLVPNNVSQDSASAQLRPQVLRDQYHQLAKPILPTPEPEPSPNSSPTVYRVLFLLYARHALAFVCDTLLFLLKLIKPNFRKLCMILVFQIVAFLIATRYGVLAIRSTPRHRDMSAVLRDEPGGEKTRLGGELYLCGMECAVQARRELARRGAVLDLDGWRSMEVYEKECLQVQRRECMLDPRMGNPGRSRRPVGGNEAHSVESIKELSEKLRRDVEGLKKVLRDWETEMGRFGDPAASQHGHRRDDEGRRKGTAEPMTARIWCQCVTTKDCRLKWRNAYEAEP